MNQPPDIYCYLNYRDYLKDYYGACKRLAPGKFSFRYLAKQAGFTSSNFIMLVMKGKRNLGYQSTQRLAKAMKLTSRETLFFEGLIHFNQSVDPQEKERAYKKMLSFREYRQAHQLTHEQFDLFAKWYYPVIREMVNLKNFREDPDWIVKHIKPRIKKEEAVQALADLIKMGLLDHNEIGCLQQVDHHVQTGSEVASAALLKFHHTMIGHGQQSLTYPAHEREISSLTVSVSSQQFQTLKKRIQEFHQEVQKIIAHDEEESSDAIYQINFQLFPLTNGHEKGVKNKTV